MVELVNVPGAASAALSFALTTGLAMASSVLSTFADTTMATS